MRIFLFFLFLIPLFPDAARAEVEHTLLRRIAVFPIAEANLSNNEEAWWQMRELLTKDQRFFVASRRFMINRGVFQPRKTLKPADAIILGKILDAQALVVTFLKERTLQMRVYEGENGYLLWEGDAEFHPALPINDQLVRMSTQLMNAFILAVPYQAFQVTDQVIGKAVYEEDGKSFAQIYIGANSKIEVGDTAQWIQVVGDVNEAFFSSTTKVTVTAEGRVQSLKGDRAVVEIQKMSDPSQLKENSLVRFPKELNRLKELYSGGEKDSNLAPEYLSSELKNSAEFSKDHQSTSTFMLWVTSLAGILLLAF
ncbi:MAG: hypothetical protein ACAH59_09760 [Pseudobdellovibrionaceae bacterium]